MNYEEFRKSLRMRLVDMEYEDRVFNPVFYKPVDCGYALAVYAATPIPWNMGNSDITVGKIMDDAERNFRLWCKPVLNTIAGFLFGDETTNLFTGNAEYVDDGGFCCLTTEDRVFGAAALFLPGIKERIAEIFDADYYVLPSSVHEVLVLPDKGKITPAELTDMVKSINGSEVSPEDRLGERVLYYRRSTGKLERT